MKLMIDIPEKVVIAIQNGEDYRYDIHTAIAQGVPYEEMPQGDLISRNALREVINNAADEEIRFDQAWAMGLKYSLKLIDNAPTVDFEKLGKSLNCQIRASYGSCDDCELSCPRNELIKLLGLKRPKGEWLHKEIDPFLKEYGQCSNCLQRERVGNFCRNCGADMRGKEE